MNGQTSVKDELRNSLRSDLARELGCEVDEIPTAVSLEDAGRFVGVTNKNTFHVWKNTKRYPLVWLKRGKALEVGSASLIEMRISQAELPEVAI